MLNRRMFELDGVMVVEKPKCFLGEIGQRIK